MGYGQRIKEARKSRGLTQAQLAQRCGMATITIQQYEADKREPRQKQLRFIADALNVSVSYLEGDESMEVRAIMDAIKRKDAREFEHLLGLKEGSITDMGTELKEGEFILSTLARDDAESTALADILSAAKQLNHTGQTVAVERVRELGKIPEYQRQALGEGGESTPAPQEGTDTTQPPDAPGEAQEDE